MNRWNALENQTGEGSYPVCRRLWKNVGSFMYYITIYTNRIVLLKDKPDHLAGVNAKCLERTGMSRKNGNV